MKGSDGVVDVGSTSVGEVAPPSVGDAAARGAEASNTTRDAESHISCPNCGEALVGDYCHRCGEKHLESRDLSVRHFLGEAAHELTSIEHSKLSHTLRALLVRPGFLTNEWIAGRRKRYLKPLNLFLGVFAVSLFAYSVYKPVSRFDVGKIVSYEKTGRLAEMVGRHAEKRHMEGSEMLDQMSERWQRFVSLSQLLFVVSFALVLQLVFVFSRRYFVEHLVFSMHFVSFSTLTLVLLWPVYFFIGFKPGGAGTLVAVLKWLLDFAYMFFAVRAVYRLGTVKTLLSSLLLVVGYFVSYLVIYVGTLIAAMITVAG